MSEISKEQLLNLINYGVSHDHLTSILTGAMYFDSLRGVPVTDYWLKKDFDNRDELFLLASTSFMLMQLATESKPKNDWRLSFDVAYLFLTKANAQSILSIDTLTKGSNGVSLPSC